eukprot:TRINITY_DN5070_c1_g2_i3.p1 TRINITY_DN5070_c1_g2~~TRINITY_DN5070_c1_g2_i3.p1  ORF type:complete len:353 (-),score=93.43 TRINITY_DN5070_c1_g2_i3:397-1455(-)
MSELNVELSKYAAPGFGLGEPWSQGGITGDRVRSLAAGPGLCACTEGTGPLECGVADLLDRVSRRKEEFATAEPEPEAHPMGEVAWSGGDARLGGGVAGGARDQGNGRSVQLRSLAANGLSSSGRSHGGGAAARKDLNSTRRTQEVQALQAEVAMQEVQLRRLLSTRPGEEISDEVAFQAATLWQGLERIRGVIGGLLERVGDPAGSEPEAAAPSAAPAGAAASASARHVVHSGSSACSGQRSARVSYVNRAQAAPQQQPQQQQQQPQQQQQQPQQQQQQPQLQATQAPMDSYRPAELQKPLQGQPRVDAQQPQPLHAQQHQFLKKRVALPRYSRRHSAWAGRCKAHVVLQA